MKIQGWDMEFSTSHSHEQFDAATMAQGMVKTRRNALAETSESGRTDAMMIIRDRISLSGETVQEKTYQYSASMHSASKVTDSEGAEISFENVEAVEKLVSSVTQQEASVRSLSILPGGIAGAPASVGKIREMHLEQTEYLEEAEQLSVASTGHVVTEDGRSIDFSLEMTMNRSFSSVSRTEMTVSQWKEAARLIDPLVISLDGSVPELSDTAFEFDLNADGETEMVHFVSGGSGFLAFDRNGDAAVNDGSELFGPGTGNGFEELAMLDKDGNDWIDENDAAFEQLSVWTKDEAGNDQLVSLKEAGIGAISLNAVQSRFNMTDSDNALLGQMQQSGVFLFEDGRAGLVHQVDLAAESIEAEPDGLDLVEADSIPDASGKAADRSTLADGMLISEIPAAAISVEPVNPLQALIDKIEEIREKLEQLYEKMDSGYEYRGRSGKQGKNRSMMESMNALRLREYLDGPVRSVRRRFA